MTTAWMRHIMLRLGWHIHHLLCHLGLFFAITAFILVSLWCIPALYYSNLPSPTLRWAAVIGYVVAAILLWKLPKKYIPYAAVILPIGVIGYWTRIPASNDRDWKTAVARTVQIAYLSDDQIQIRNIRDFRYRTEEDCDIRYLDQEYAVSAVRTVDYIVVHWDGQEAIAHSMLSFGFADGRHLAFSAETRLEKNEEYSTLKGIFKQFEIAYIWGTEEDLFGLRTNYRHEQLYLYPTESTPREAQIIFRDLVARTARLEQEPMFYNTLTENCLTSLLPSLLAAYPYLTWDMRILLNGFSDRYAFDHQWLAGSSHWTKPFTWYKQQHYANARVDFLTPFPETGYSTQLRQTQKITHSK